MGGGIQGHSCFLGGTGFWWPGVMPRGSGQKADLCTSPSMDGSTGESENRCICVSLRTTRRKGSCLLSAGRIISFFCLTPNCARHYGGPVDASRVRVTGLESYRHGRWFHSLLPAFVTSAEFIWSDLVSSSENKVYPLDKIVVDL